MKKILTIVCAVTILIGFHARCYAYCENVNIIELDITAQVSQSQAWQIVKDALDNYTNYESNNRYELCFNFPNDALNIQIPGQVLPLGQDPSPKPVREVVIHGLKLNQTGSVTAPLLTINYPYAKVILADLEITNASKGLEVLGTDVEIINPTIAGDGTGPCVRLFKTDDVTIQRGDISGCSEGILLDYAYNTLIGAEDSANYEQDKVSIHNNGIGIHLLSGDGNRWGYNSIYENESGQNLNEPRKDGISIDVGGNAGILPPVVKTVTNEGALQCERDESGKILSRKIEFESLPYPGKIVIYEATITHKQGIKYITECEVNTDGLCLLGELPPWLGISENQCGVSDLEAVAIFTADNSSAYSPLRFDGPSSIPAIPTDLPASMPGVVDERDITASGEEADILSGGASGEASGAGGAAGMGMKCGGTLVPSATLSGSALLHSLVWMTLPLLPVIVFRRRKK